MRPASLPICALAAACLLLSAGTTSAGEDGAAAPRPPPLRFLGLNTHGAEEWWREKDGAIVIRIPGGEYLRRPYEGWVAIEEPKPFPVPSFFVDKHEVTNARFARFLADTAEPERLVRSGVRGIVRGAEGRFEAEPGLESHPVTAATGHGAVAYARWVGGRLPMQTEWEKAAGGPEGRLYPWGDEPPDALRANFGRPPRGLLPVGSLAVGASPYGALDMAGNAYDRVVPEGRGRDGLPEMIKGGAWLSPHPLNLRVLDLCMQDADVAEASVGFRCAMDDPEPDRPTHRIEAAAPLRLATSFDAGVEEARRRRVPVFLVLLYDTCGQCDRTREECFRDPRFVAYANEHLVVLLGHSPGDALDEPHPPGEEDRCPLYPGLTCTQHEVIFARGLEVVEGFRVSPGCFLLHPDKIRKGAGTDAILVPEEAFPKWGDDAPAYLAAFAKARGLVK